MHRAGAFRVPTFGDSVSLVMRRSSVRFRQAAPLERPSSVPVPPPVPGSVTETFWSMPVIVQRASSGVPWAATTRGPYTGESAHVRYETVVVTR